METRELIEQLYQYHKDYGQDAPIRLYQISLDCKKAADRLVELQNLVDDMLGDHYVDYLEFYTNRCRELEETLKAISLLCATDNL